VTSRWQTAAATTAVSVVGLTVVGVIGLATHQPWLFPSLGPTLMVLAETPREPPAAPRSVLLGHGVALGAGWLALAVTGLLDAPSVLQQGITAARICAAVLSLVLTATVLIAIRAPHPPAGATTLIVSLGLLHTAGQLLVMAASVTVILIAAIATRVATERLFAKQTRPFTPA